MDEDDYYYYQDDRQIGDDDNSSHSWDQGNVSGSMNNIAHGDAPSFDDEYSSDIDSETQDKILAAIHYGAHSIPTATTSESILAKKHGDRQKTEVEEDDDEDEESDDEGSRSSDETTIDNDDDDDEDSRGKDKDQSDQESDSRYRASVSNAGAMSDGKGGVKGDALVSTSSESGSESESESESEPELESPSVENDQPDIKIQEQAEPRQSKTPEEETLVTHFVDLSDTTKSNQVQPVAVFEEPPETQAGVARYFLSAEEVQKTKLCNFCRQPGHLSRNCPQKSKLCNICNEDHDPARCALASMICWNCSGMGHESKDCLNEKIHIYCEYCETSMHRSIQCPYLWRRYHYVSNAKHSKRSTKVRAYCYNCGDADHFGDDCPRRNPHQRRAISIFCSSSYDMNYPWIRTDSLFDRDTQRFRDTRNHDRGSGYGRSSSNQGGRYDERERGGSYGNHRDRSRDYESRNNNDRRRSDGGGGARSSGRYDDGDNGSRKRGRESEDHYGHQGERHRRFQQQESPRQGVQSPSHAYGTDSHSRRTSSHGNNDRGNQYSDRSNTTTNTHTRFSYSDFTRGSGPSSSSSASQSQSHGGHGFGGHGHRGGRGGYRGGRR